VSFNGIKDVRCLRLEQRVFDGVTLILFFFCVWGSYELSGQAGKRRRP